MSTVTATKRHRTRGRELPQMLALGFGALYVVVGIVGFLVTGLNGGLRGFAEPDTNKLLLGMFELNPFHNVGHLLTGMMGLALGWTLASARFYGLVLAASHVMLLGFGLLYANRESPLNFFSFNQLDNVLHAGVIAIGLVIAFLPTAAERRVRA